MPNARSCLRVRLVWLFRALALWCCWYAIFSAVWSRSRVAVDRPSHQECTKAAAAVRTWHTVSSGFFPPLPLVHARQEQVGHGSDRLVTQQAAIIPTLVMIEPQLCFLILEAALHVPAGKGHPQQHLQARSRRRVADEVFHLVRRQHVAGYEQIDRPARVAIFGLWIEPHPLGLPDHRSFGAILDAEALPGLVAQGRAMAPQIAHPRGRSAGPRLSR